MASAVSLAVERGPAVNEDQKAERDEAELVVGLAAVVATYVGKK